MKNSGSAKVRNSWDNIPYKKGSQAHESSVGLHLLGLTDAFSYIQTNAKATPYTLVIQASSLFSSPAYADAMSFI